MSFLSKTLDGFLFLVYNIYNYKTHERMIYSVKTKIPVRRLLALGGAALMLSVCAACNKPTSSKASGSTVSGLPSIPQKDLGGYEFKIMDFNSGRWDRNASNPTPFTKAMGNMLDNTEKFLNCKITAMNSANPGEIINAAQPAILSGDKYADLIVTTQWAYGFFMGAGIVQDLNNLKCNWNAPWWNQNIRQMSTVQGKTYAANGSFIFDAAQSWMLYYNGTLWNQLNLPDPYELVNSGKWTIDLFAKYAKLATQDLNGDGKMDTTNDQWGVVAPDGDFCRAFYLSGGNHYFKEVDGKFQLAVGDPDSITYVNKMRQMNVIDKSVSPKGTDGADGQHWYVQQFIDGKALFMAYMPGTGGLTDMQDDWGAMPLPKASESQANYMTGVDWNASVCGVTITNQDIDKDALILDALGYFGNDLQGIYWPDYTQTYWRHEQQDADIVKNYIAGKGVYDIGIIMSNVQSSFSSAQGLVFNSMYGGVSDLASAVKAQQDKINTDVQMYFDGKMTTTTKPSAAVTAAATTAAS